MSCDKIVVKIIVIVDLPSLGPSVE